MFLPVWQLMYLQPISIYLRLNGFLWFLLECGYVMLRGLDVGTGIFVDSAVCTRTEDEVQKYGIEIDDDRPNPILIAIICCYVMCPYFVRMNNIYPTFSYYIDLCFCCYHLRSLKILLFSDPPSHSQARRKPKKPEKLLAAIGWSI